MAILTVICPTTHGRTERSGIGEGPSKKDNELITFRRKNAAIIMPISCPHSPFGLQFRCCEGGGETQVQKQNAVAHCLTLVGIV